MGAQQSQAIGEAVNEADQQQNAQQQVGCLGGQHLVHCMNLVNSRKLSAKRRPNALHFL